MQDLQSIAGSTGRIYIGDRRTRPCPNQTLKCPRCDSLNTKFCYFNNYNLSQPRHFCKSCRRYWTKGGVLRNVPVGGGCRKSKRSKPKHSSDTQIGKTSKSSSNSSSESSTFTAGAVAVVTAEASASSTSAFFPNPNPNSRYETPTLASFDQTTDSVVGVFPDTGNFVDTIAPSTTSMIGFHFSDPSPLRSHYNSQKLTNSEEFKLPDFLDQTVPMDLPPLQSKTNDSEFTVFDWNVNGEQGLFELTGNNDHGFWNQNQWAENDNLLPFHRSGCHVRTWRRSTGMEGGPTQRKRGVHNSRYQNCLNLELRRERQSQARSIMNVVFRDIKSSSLHWIPTRTFQVKHV